MRTIVFATDGSESAKSAAQQVKVLLDAFPDCQLHVLHVIKPLYAADGFGFVQQPIDDSADEVARLVKRDAEEEFLAYRQRTRFTVQHGSPAVAICQFAEQNDADLIVVGSHGRGAVDRLILGSVSNGVVHRAKQPVLVAK